MPVEMNPPQEERGNWIDYTVSVGTAIGLFLAAIPLVDKLDQHSVNGFMVLATRVGATIIVSAVATGAGYVTNRIRHWSFSDL